MTSAVNHGFKVANTKQGLKTGFLMMVFTFCRVLNVFSHVIDELIPGPPQIKTSLPSLPQAPSLSPMKRKAKGEKDTGSNPGTPNQDGKTASKSQKGEYLLNKGRTRLQKTRPLIFECVKLDSDKL